MATSALLIVRRVRARLPAAARLGGGLWLMAAGLLTGLRLILINVYTSDSLASPLYKLENVGPLGSVVHMHSSTV